MIGTNSHSQVKSLLSKPVSFSLFFSCVFPLGPHLDKGIPCFLTRGEDRMSVGVARWAPACAARNLHFLPGSIVYSFMYLLSQALC